MSENRITYASRAETYQLNPTKVFEVVASINDYLYFAVSQEKKDNPNQLKSVPRLIRKGRKLVLHTEVVNEPGFLTSFDLAELVLAEDNSKLTLSINGHPRVAVPSDDLHHIVSKYVLKK